MLTPHFNDKRYVNLIKGHIVSLLHLDTIFIAIVLLFQFPELERVLSDHNYFFVISK